MEMSQAGVLADCHAAGGFNHRTTSVQAVTPLEDLKVVRHLKMEIVCQANVGTCEFNY